MRRSRSLKPKNLVVHSTPSVLQQYQKILPTTPERIVSMAEQQQSHENAVVKKALDSEVKIKKGGQIYAFLLMFLVALLSAYALRSLQNKPKPILF